MIKFNMKPGDKLLCKRSFVGWGNGESLLYTKGKCYEMLGIGIDGSIAIYHNRNPGYHMFDLTNSDKTQIYLFDFFYTTEELRLLKLESL